MTTVHGQPVTVADLRPVDLFSDLDDAALSQWAAVASWREVTEGNTITDEGEESEGLLCLLEGTLQVYQRGREERFEPVSHQRAPTWIGAVATLTETPLLVRMVAVTPARAALIPAEDFRRLVLAHPAVHRLVMRQVAPLMSRMASVEQNRERLAALGTMAAGLAHELGNPVAAARSSATQLGEALAVIGQTLRAFVTAGLEREDAARIADLRDQALSQCAGRGALSALDASDAEDLMIDRLEKMGVPEPWRLADPLAVAGVDQEWLDQIQAAAGTATPAALSSIAASLNAQRVVADLREATERMSSLVSASRRTPTWIAEGSSRPTSTRVWRRPSPCWDTGSSTPRSRLSATTIARCRN